MYCIIIIVLTYQQIQLKHISFITWQLPVICNLMFHGLAKDLSCFVYVSERQLHPTSCKWLCFCLHVSPSV